MGARQQRMLERKRENLRYLRSTVQPGAIASSASARPFQVDSRASLTEVIAAGAAVQSVVAATPGAGQTPGVYVINAVNAGGDHTGGGAQISVTVNGAGVVSAVALVSAGAGYTALPTFAMPGGAGGAPPATFTVTLAPPGITWEWTPVQYPAGRAAPVEIARYQVPSGMSGAIKKMVIIHVGAPGSFTDFSGQLLWHVLKNGFPVRGWENLYAQAGSLQTPVDTYILLQQNDLVQVLVESPTNPPAGTPFVRLIGDIVYGGLGTYVSEDRGNDGGGRGASGSMGNGGR